MLSATTTMAGFAVLLFSPMPIIQDFGLDHRHHCVVLAGAGADGSASVGGVVRPRRRIMASEDGTG